VQAPVTLWWGDDDRVCPPPIGGAFAERLPNAELRLVEGTHQLLFARWRDILAGVV
jgi:pimeloyl-ACP methyl ester carboxylesterase